MSENEERSVMGRGLILALAATLALLAQPALAQTPAARSMPAGTQNPALAQPQLVAPAPVQLVPPSPPITPPPSAPTSPGALIVPGGAGGLCECLIDHDPSHPTWDKTRMQQRCLASADACQAVCNTERFYSFIPHATYTCPGNPGDATGHIAMNMQPAMRLLSRR
jgi:hypothetical protein